MARQFLLAAPNMVTDWDGFWRYPPHERAARVTHTLTHGQDLSITLELSTLLHAWRGFGDSLYVLELHRGPNFVELSGNPSHAPWRYHVSLCRVRELTAPLILDLVRVIGQCEGWGGAMRIHQVCDMSTHIPDWNCPSVGPVWNELRRLRATGGQLGQVTWSA